MLKINNESYNACKIETIKYKYSRDLKVINDTYKVVLYYSDELYIMFNQTKSLDFFNNFRIGSRIKINEFIDDKNIEISYNGLWTEELIDSNEIYLTKVDDYTFKIELTMNSFIWNIHGINYLYLEEIVKFQKD